MESRHLHGKRREICEKKKRLVWIRKELWQQVSDAAVGKEITFRMGTHEFSGWLKREIQHKEEDKDV